VIGGRAVTAMKARELGRGNIVVGDTVSLTGDVSGARDTLARVIRVEPRRTVLRRSADDTDPVERAIVANADQMLIVTSLANPEPRLRLIDRFLVAAYDAGIEPVLCLTKADLAGPESILPVYGPLGVRYLVLGRPIPEPALAQVRELLADKVSVLVGQSGVGKSTLVNLLIPDADRVVGTVSPVTGRGRHTSSSVVALALPGGGWIIDTPGLRSFGLGHLSADSIVAAFPDLAELATRCQPGCDHMGADCVLDAAIAEVEGSAGTSGAARLDSLRRLLRSIEGGGSGAAETGDDADDADDADERADRGDDD
jgi:ribosome biogenesis GTPase